MRPNEEYLFTLKDVHVTHVRNSYLPRVQTCSDKRTSIEGHLDHPHDTVNYCGSDIWT